MVGFEFDRPAAGGNGLVQSAAEAEHLAEIGVVERDVSPRCDRLLQELNPARRVAGLMGHDPEQMQCWRVLGEGLEDLATQAFRFRQAAGITKPLRQGDNLTYRHEFLAGRHSGLLAAHYANHETPTPKIPLRNRLSTCR